MPVSHRSVAWKWWVCGLLLLATMLNYMDRLTLNQTADRIKAEFGLTNTQYGEIEAVFAIAFALGALGAGWMADRFNVQWLYPAALVGWSFFGFATAFSQSFFELLLFRFLLGLFESGNWPCALRTTQRILPPSERPMGNGILQSGASMGAIITPLIVLFFLQRTDNWRYPFMAVGVCGSFWVVLWLIFVRRRDLALPDWDAAATTEQSAGSQAMHASMSDIFADRRFYILALIVVSINAAWHFFRAWLPLFLKEAHGYGDETRQWFSSAYYLSADVGALGAGFAGSLAGPPRPIRPSQQARGVPRLCPADDPQCRRRSSASRPAFARRIADYRLRLPGLLPQLLLPQPGINPAPPGQVNRHPRLRQLVFDGIAAMDRRASRSTPPGRTPWALRRPASRR